MTLREKADIALGRWVRRRDCPDGWGRCISCGRVVTYAEGQCGHFIPRGHMATRYDERNCNLQCESCNEYQDGNLAGYTIGLIERYGDGIIEELNALKHATVKFSKSDYMRLIERYDRD